jgi:sensor histidine kinase regulating citrate/malate metabolism
MGQEIKIKLKIFCIIFGLLVVFTNYYEYRTEAKNRASVQESIQAKAIEKAKAQAALAEQRKNRQQFNNNPSKSEQEYADKIRANLEKNCNFWKDQYDRSRVVQYKTERDNACRLVGRYFQ